MRARLSRLREELDRARRAEQVLLEQVQHLADIAEDAERRKLTADTPLAEREWRDARTDLDRHTASLEDTRQRIADLLAEQDALLDRLLERQPDHRAEGRT